MATTPPSAPLAKRSVAETLSSTSISWSQRRHLRLRLGDIAQPARPADQASGCPGSSARRRHLAPRCRARPRSRSSPACADRESRRFPRQAAPARQRQWLPAQRRRQGLCGAARPRPAKRPLGGRRESWRRRPPASAPSASRPAHACPPEPPPAFARHAPRWACRRRRPRPRVGQAMPHSWSSAGHAILRLSLGGASGVGRGTWPPVARRASARWLQHDTARSSQRRRRQSQSSARLASLPMIRRHVRSWQLLASGAQIVQQAGICGPVQRQARRYAR